MRRKKYNTKYSQDPRGRKEKKISDYYEKYTKLTFDALNKIHINEKNLLEKLEEKLSIIGPNHDLFCKMERSMRQVQAEQLRFGFLVDRYNESITKISHYHQKGVIQKFFSSAPRQDLHRVAAERDGYQVKLQAARTELQQLKSAVEAVQVTLDGNTYSGNELGTLKKSIGKKRDNASIRLLAQIKALEYLGVKEAHLKERESIAAFKVDTYRAYAAAYFDQTRKLAEGIKRNLLKQEEILCGCPYCGNSLGETPHADHIYPVSKGGLSTVTNMVLVCINCNLRKSNYTLREFIERCGLDRNTVEHNLVVLKKDF